MRDVLQVWPVRKVARPNPSIDDIGGLPVWTSHSQTGVLDLHTQGVMGEGITVGVVGVPVR
jgi:hypothetical protein